jgi:hypothetical protein
MTIEKIPTEKLIPYARNAKKHDAAQVSKLAGSIREFGFNNPVLIDAQNGIIAGHGRVMAAQKLELKEVPCIRLGHLTDTQRRAYILADNRLSEIGGGWDEEMLKNELTSLLGDGVDIAGLGWDDGWSEDGGLGENGEAYTRKVESPKYEPKKTKPSVPELFDSTKTKSMIEKIKKSLNPNVKTNEVDFFIYQIIEPSRLVLGLNGNDPEEEYEKYHSGVFYHTDNINCHRQTNGISYFSTIFFPIFNEKAVFPIDGRPAIIIRSDF